MLAHDWLCGYRGGEAVLERIARLIDECYEPAGLLTMFDDGRRLAPTIDRWRARGLVRSASINDWPGAATKLRRWLLPMYPIAVGELSRMLRDLHAANPIDLVVSTSSAAIKGLKPPEGVPHLCYCHSPARYIWSQGAEYGARRGVSEGGGHGAAVLGQQRGAGASPTLSDRARAAGLAMARRRYQAWDRRTAANVTRFIANSSYTAAEILRCFGRKAITIHPPVRTEYFTPASTHEASAAGQGSDWLWVGAIEPYKRIDLAIQAAKLAGVRLVVAGGGSMFAALQRDMPAHVELLGRVPDERIRELYRSSRLLVFPQVEDFGIVAAEALACGLPVLARGAGGAMDIVMDGKTGAFFHEPTAEAMAEAWRRVPERSEATTRACRGSAERFAESVFDRMMADEMKAAFEPG